MKMRRLLSCMMALLLAASLPVSALADTYDLAEGSVSVNASESGQTVTYKEETRPESAPVITQSGSSETSTPHTVTIEAGSGSTANVTLKDVNISADGAAMEIKGSGSAVIELDGKNIVQSGEGHAGVEKNNNGSLTITDKNDNPGSLEATGSAGGSGIGGGEGGDGSKIYIEGGTVKATGREQAAGIGGGKNGNGSEVTISGGTVEAKGGEGGSGIGGGDGGTGSNITISGGTVEAKGGAGGSGIGGGDGSKGIKITLSGGTVTANGGEGGSGIGGGDGGDGSDIRIRGDKVTAKGGENAAGIGGGAGGDGDSIVIAGGIVDAIGGDASSYETDDGIVKGEGGGSGIGGGAYGIGSNISILNDAVVTAAGKGNASNIGFGHSKDSTEKLPDKVDVSGLTSSGSVNGVPGSYTSDAGDDDADATNDGFRDFTSGHTLHKGYTIGRSELFALTDQDGNNLPSELKMEKNQLTITVAANNATLIGDRDELQTLIDRGTEETVLKTNRVSVSVSNDLLMKITNADESFQLSTEGTSVSLTTNDQNNKKYFDMKLTTDGTQEERKETQENTQGLVTYEIDCSKEPNNDQLNSLLHLLSDSVKASLTLSGGSLQTLTDRGIVQTVLSTNGVTSSIDHKRALETAKISDSLKLSHDGNKTSFQFNGISAPSSSFVMITKPDL